MEKVTDTARRFVRKELKGQVDFNSIVRYIQSIGFSVIPYNCNKDNELLIKYNLLEFSKTVKGFTVFRKDFKAVFIDSDTPSAEKLCVLLHETAHIILGHIDKKDIKDERTLEMEADAFAYEILNYKPINPIKVIAVSSAVILSGLCGFAVCKEREVLKQCR